ncbi:MAG: hypothetical protein CL799_02540 [Chromatiales bacterium]|jgi:hypothetical protein|nr:hypothetical protein [Chromatiales bacterium]MDP7270502.1 amidohydrolase family protein [Gammaproteobacteria bacterium]HJP05754.1 amidohydrolase family protein [Gammaproteobacteria bacterium]
MKSRLSLLAAVALLSACSTEPPEQFGIVVDGSRIQVVDLHTHSGTWENTPPGFRKRLGGRVPRGFYWLMSPLTDLNLGPGNILSQMNSAGIYGAGVFATISPNTTGNATTEFVAKQIAGNEDRLYGFATIRLDRWNVDQAERLAKFEEELATIDSMHGIKLAHAHQQYRLDDERLWPIYELAGKYGKPIYFHTGTSPNPGTRYEPEYADAMYLESAIQAHPDTIFILGHTGYDTRIRALTYVNSAILMAQRYPNVYLEPGALGAERGEEVIDDFVTRLKDQNVLHKVIYGSDGVQFPGYLKSHLTNYVAAMQRNGYTKDEMRQVLAGNFVKVFGIEIPGIETAAEEGE